MKSFGRKILYIVFSIVCLAMGVWIVDVYFLKNHFLIGLAVLPLILIFLFLAVYYIAQSYSGKRIKILRELKETESEDQKL